MSHTHIWEKISLINSAYYVCKRCDAEATQCECGKMLMGDQYPCKSCREAELDVLELWTADSEDYLADRIDYPDPEDWYCDDEDLGDYP